MHTQKQVNVCREESGQKMTALCKRLGLRNFHGFQRRVALLCMLIIGVGALIACAPSEQQETPAKEELTIAGEVIEINSCFVLLPEGWSRLDNSNLLCNDTSEKYAYIDIWLSDTGRVASDVQKKVDADLNPEHPAVFVGTQGEDVTIAGITFKTVNYAEEDKDFGIVNDPKVGLFGLLGDQVLRIQFTNINIDDPLVEAVVASIVPKT